MQVVCAARARYPAIYEISEGVANEETKNKEIQEVRIRDRRLQPLKARETRGAHRGCRSPGDTRHGQENPLQGLSYAAVCWCG